MLLWPRDGTLCVTDFRNYRVKKVTPAGVVSIFAESGSSGYANGTGTAASFSNMSGVAIASDDTIYIADSGNYRIRKITPSGVVSTYAGSGTRGTSDGTATSAQFYWPKDIAIARDGTLYVTENEGNRIRKIATDGTVTTLAGSPSAGSADGTGASAGFYYPRAIVVGPDDNLYVADAGNGLIRKVTASGVVSTFAGTAGSGYADGTGTSAKFNWPNGLALGPDGVFYVADAGNNRIRKIQ